MQVVHTMLLMRVHSPRCATVMRCCLGWFEVDDERAPTLYFWNPNQYDCKREWRAGKVQVSETLYKAALCLRVCCNHGFDTETFANTIRISADQRSDFVKHLDDSFFKGPLFCDVSPRLENWCDCAAPGPKPDPDGWCDAAQVLKG